MSVYRPAQQQAVNRVAQNIREALMLTGEQIVTLHTYTVVEDEGRVPRCPVCFDDVYKQQSRFNCPECYGTTFLGGIKASFRAWAVFGENVTAVDQDQRGQWNPETKKVQIESYPTLQQSDFLARVIQWNRENTPAVVGDIYAVGPVSEQSVRSGSRYFPDAYTQVDNTNSNNTVPAYDRVAQSATATLLTRDHPIYNYPLTGTPVARFDGLPRG